MYCDENLHYYLKEHNYIICPFCLEQIEECHSKPFQCCFSMNVDLYDHSFVCFNCGSVHGYEKSLPYIDFYENRYRIKRKSVYNRKYHLQNKIRSLVELNNIQISYSDQQKILDIFETIDKILPIVNNKTRKRMIKIDFILNKLFHLLNINIKISQKESKNTSLCNEKYWEKINSLIGDKIQAIIDR